MTGSRSPVSPIELHPLSSSHRFPPSSQAPIVSTLPAQGSSTSTSPSQSPAAPINSPSSPDRKESWLPFTLQWYYLIIPTILSLCLGSVVIYLTIYSNQNHGIGADDGSSAILFGWRFTPTLIAVLYTQMTVILFEDVKRTEPFARLAKAPAGGASAYGTLLQTPRAWWAIFIDACFKRNRTGRTSWTLICAALINVIALLAISPLSSALLTSEEVLIPETVDFTRIIPKSNTQLSMVPTRDTYYRAMNALLRNVSTSAWVTDTTIAFPFWPSSEAAQLGPNLDSPYGTWNTQTTTLQSKYQCQDMTLKSADLSQKRYSDVYSAQGYGPLNGTQPMVTFSLESGDGCRYELLVHPAVDIAAYGGVTWSDASTFYPTHVGKRFPLGGRLFSTNMTSTHIYSRVNASEQCKNRDIIIMSTPWTVPLPDIGPSFPSIPQNFTYERSTAFRMRAILCDPQYLVSKHAIKMVMAGGALTDSDIRTKASESSQKVAEDFINTLQFQAKSTQDDWRTYFDSSSVVPQSDKPGFSGMAPLLAAYSRFSLSTLLDDRDISKKAASLKGRFFMETLRESFTNPQLVKTDITRGEATMIRTRVVVLTEIGITLATLFYASSILLAIVFWSSRPSFRPLNLRSDPASIIGLSLLLKQRLTRSSTINSMHNASRTDFYTALQNEKYLTSNNELIKGDDNTDPPIKIKVKRDWRPRVIHVRMLVSLGLLLALVLIAVLILNAFSARSQLYQLAFIYEADVSKLGFSFSTFAPISIAPTVVSIVIGLWWDQLDMTFRVLQPFISMSRSPTPIHVGAGLTYRSKTWAGAAFKAGRNRHWVLFMIAIGSVLAQVLTVSMSALFERETRNVVQNIPVSRTLEMRQIPLITEVRPDANLSPPENKMLDKLYDDAPKNWLLGAGIQQSYNGSQLPWAANGWSFTPLDLSSPGFDAAVRALPNMNTNNTFSSVKVTVSTSAIRARLQCRVIDEVANSSSWIAPAELSNEDELYKPEDFAQINRTRKLEPYRLRRGIFLGTDSQTTISSRAGEMRCCSNGTRLDPQPAVMGYWSPTYPRDSDPSSLREQYPYKSFSWPLPIVVKWVVGNPFNITEAAGKKRSLWFNEIPQIQAARCIPIIETAEATVTVNKDTGNVVSHQLINNTTTTDVAWADVFTRHEFSSRTSSNGSFSKSLNMTASFGVVFLDSLLGAADRGDENIFVFRDPNNGLSMDLMTYSMYTMANKDAKALLNYTTLVTNADRTFQKFFQHFVNNGLSLSKGGPTYQPIGDNSMEFIGKPTDENGTFIDQKTFPVLNTNRIEHQLLKLAL